MKQVVLISHGDFAVGAQQAAEFILGRQPDLYALGLDAQQGITAFRTALKTLITRLYATEQPIIIIADLLYGSPWNGALQIITQQKLWGRVILLSGLSLPLLLGVLTGLDSMPACHTLNEIINNAREAINYQDGSRVMKLLRDGDE